MIELKAIDLLEVIITYVSCLEFAEQCYKKSLFARAKTENLYYYLNHGQTIHSTENFILLNLLQMSCVITWDQKKSVSISEKRMRSFFSFELH